MLTGLKMIKWSLKIYHYGEKNRVELKAPCPLNLEFLLGKSSTIPSLARDIINMAARTVNNKQSSIHVVSSLCSLNLHRSKKICKK